MKVNYLKHFILFFISISISGITGINSPDKNISLEFFISDGKAFYKIDYKNRAIIDTSGLGFEFQNIPPFIDDLQITRLDSLYFDETWEPVWGEEKFIRNNYNELEIHLSETREPNRRLIIRFRVYNDGVGFRFEFPEQSNMSSVTITNERTQFNITGDHQCWWIPADYDSYEYLYNTTKISEIDAKKFGYENRLDRHVMNFKAVNTPITFKAEEDLYISLHEANLTDYAGMTLVLNENYNFESELVPWSDGTKVKTSTPFNTPWRTILIVDSADKLLTSNLILNLNEPNIIDDVSWIEPIKYMGIWWEMHIGKSSWAPISLEGSWADKGTSNHGATTENAKNYIDFASQHGIRGMLIEGWNTGWEHWGLDTVGYFDFVTPYSDFDLIGLIQYAKDKNVEIIGHHETGGQVTNYEKHLENAFAFYNKLGIRTVKTGYAGGIIPKGEFHHGQFMVRHYRKVLETAVDYQIMINAHEPIKPTGIRRTYPNMMTREGVRGMEWNAWSDGNKPEHTTIIPFTRGLGGPIDYTPGIFDITFKAYKDKEKVHSTLANQLALYVILYSPIQMAADLPENYEGNPAFQFIKDVPVNWDQIQVISAEIGDYVSIARRNGEDWFIGCITDENEREVEIPLTFLNQDVGYSANIYVDAPAADYETNPAAINIYNQKVDDKTILKLKLSRGGGCAISIKPTGD